MLTESWLDALNEAEPETAERELMACCAARRWADELIVRRPYLDVATLEQVSDTIFAELGWGDVQEALAAHPRIGERADGDGAEARWSRAEQSAAATGDEDVNARLHAASLAYEEHFGWVFLIFATGLSAQQILDALHERMDNDEQTEHAVVRDELRKIAHLRLRTLALS